LSKPKKHFERVSLKVAKKRIAGFKAVQRGGEDWLRIKKTIGVDVSEEVVNAFEAGIVFGRMVEARRPRPNPLWSEEEWLQALIEVVGKKAESKVRESNAGLNGDGQPHDG
jgi:hypothetical protein